MKKQIFLDAPNIGTLEKRALCKAVDSGFVSTVGPFVGEFETVFASYLGVKRAVSTQSGTAAIHTALYELGIGKGDEVIVPALTFVATVNPIKQVGAKPVFADIDPETWNIDPRAIEPLVTKRTKAVLPVHLYGNPCDMGAVKRTAKKHGLFVIEDATESLGAKYRGEMTGTIGDLGCFSFNGNKIITTGGGGMIAGNSEKTMKHIKFLVNQARDESRGYYHPEIGFNYRMTNIEAALGLSQMKRLKGFLSAKKAFSRIYRETLGGIDFVRFQEEYPEASSSWWLTCVKFTKKIDIPSLINSLKTKGVPTRRIFMPITAFPPYSERDRARFRASFYVYENGLCLPGSTLNSTEEIIRISKIIRKEITEHGKN